MENHRVGSEEEGEGSNDREQGEKIENRKNGVSDR